MPTNKTFMTFIKRYYKLLIVAALFIFLTRFNEVFNLIGTFMYLPALVAAAAATALFLRNIFNDQTTDDHVDSGEYVKVWNELEPKERFKYTYWQWITYFIGACIVAAAIAF